MNVDPLLRLASRWREDAERFRSYGADTLATACERHADALEERVRSWELEALTVGKAAEESGYSESHLRALLSEGKLENVGHDGAPRLRRADLPRKAQRTHAGPESLVDEALRRRA